MEGVDYSYARPNLAGLVNAGKRFVVRYIGPGSSSKYITDDEKAAILRAGLELVLVYEDSAGFMVDSDGQAAGRTAQQRLSALDMEGAPVYFALDVDARGLNAQQWLQVQGFLNGASLVLGQGKTGVYGSYLAIERLVPGFARYGWQTYAWSAGARSSKAALYQYRNDVQLAGGAVDLDVSLKADYGQFQGSSDETTKEDALQALDEAARQVYGVTGVAVWLDVVLRALRDANTNAQKAEGVAKLIGAHPDTIDYAKLAAAIVKELSEL